MHEQPYRIRKTLLAGAGAAALLLGTGVAANAGGMIEGPVPDWSGFYFGMHLGGGDADVDGTWNPSEQPPLSLDELDVGGVLGGVQGGYNWQDGSWLYGIEIDATATGWSDSARHTAGSEAIVVQHDLLASVRGRLGMAMDNMLMYVTGGLALQNGNWHRMSAGNCSTRPCGGDLETVGGVVGGGVSWKAQPNVSLGVEGLVYFFGSESLPRDFEDGEDGGSIDTTPWAVRFPATYHIPPM